MCTWVGNACICIHLWFVCECWYTDFMEKHWRVTLRTHFLPHSIFTILFLFYHESLIHTPDWLIYIQSYQLHFCFCLSSHFRNVCDYRYMLQYVTIFMCPKVPNSNHHVCTQNNLTSLGLSENHVYIYFVSTFCCSVNKSQNKSVWYVRLKQKKMFWPK